MPKGLCLTFELVAAAGMAAHGMYGGSILAWCVCAAGGVWFSVRRK
jgi:hypothetical protein